MSELAESSLLIVDDDVTFCRVLARAMTGRGYTVSVAHDVPEAIAKAERAPPRYAVVDLRMPGPTGLTLVRRLRELDRNARIVVLTGYASIATAVKAIKLGADDYLAKPVTAAAVAAVLERDAPASSEGAEQPLQTMSPRRLEWEHIQRVLAEHDGNISATARSLRMHRRTLQRKLGKKPTQS